MFATLHRQKGASALGAQHSGESGPYGTRPAEDDDGEDDEQQHHTNDERTPR